MSKNTSLAVVAPGIAEALFATALGLVAAIPAVLAYNKFCTDLGRYAGRLEGFADEFGAILSRQREETRRWPGRDRGPGADGRASRRPRRRRRYRPMSEINVTPMVDVMLVLLIIFMVDAPLLTVGVQVDLPKTRATPVNRTASR